MKAKTRQNAPKIVFAAIVVPILACGGLALLTYIFGASGGQIAVQSPTVEIDSDSVGDVVTIVGDDNAVQLQRPYEQPEPESIAHRTGELIYMTALMAAVVGAFWYWWRRVRNGFEFIMVQQKEPKQ